MGYRVYLLLGISVSWHPKILPEFGPLTADLTTTDVHSYKLLINNVKSVHLLTLYHIKGKNHLIPMTE